MEQRILSLFLIVGLVISLLGSFSVSAAQTATIMADDVEAGPGETVTIDLAISENPGVAGIKLNCTYPTGWVLQDIQQREALSSMTLTKPGMLTMNPFSFVLDGLDADTSNGVFLTLIFEIPSWVSEGRYEIYLDYTAGDVYDDNLNDLDVNLFSGEVVVTSDMEGTVSCEEDQTSDSTQDPIDQEELSTEDGVAESEIIETPIISDVPDRSFSYNDVSPDDWFWTSVSYVSQHGVMSGVAEEQFAPHNTVSRAMMAQILYNLEGRPSVDATNHFSDGNGQWYSPAVTWTAQNGIVTGFADGSFAANLPVTREQIVVMLHRYADFKGYDLTSQKDLTAFVDSSSIGNYARAAMEWAVGEGLIAGMDGRIFPHDPALRCQIAAIMERFLKQTYE